jgi:hypothetical protein
MIHAVIRRKVPSEVRRQEDVLTASVFGILDLIPARYGLLPWLAQARRLDGTRLTLDEHELEQRSAVFWPSYTLPDRSTVEPDLVLDCPGRLFVIEAKYGSGPSGLPSSDELAEVRGQLGRQWRAVTLERKHGAVTLIYVTADWSMPRSDMEQMVKEVHGRGLRGDLGEALYGLTWRMLDPLLATATGHVYVDRARAHLRDFLEVSGLSSFTGIALPARTLAVPWTYERRWSVDPTTMRWEYRR